ncbi:MAG: hypothetical protein KF833_01220 [Verrucomicrobiae bacterium]|nr:hypothetical protein [Verrucomicrobiae bacterium]
MRPDLRAGTAAIHRDDLVKTSRSRLQSGVLALVTLALGLHAFFAYRIAREEVLGEADQFVRDKARLLARGVNPANPAFVEFNERDWRDDRFTPYAQSFDVAWDPRFVSSRLDHPILVTDEFRRLARHPLGMHVDDVVDAVGTAYRAATAAVQRGEEVFGYALVAVRVSDRDAPLRHLALRLAGGSLLCIALTAAGLHLVLRQWQLPLVTFAETARGIATHGAGRHRFVAPPDSPELVELAGTFNQLLDRQASLQESQQRFVADAAHELRTPLTVLRGELEIALRRERSGPEYRETIENCREEIERLARLTENLLALARLDSGAGLELRESLDLGTLCREAAERLEPRAREQGAVFDVQATATLPVLGDRLALERVLFNLLDNGLRYTPRGEMLTLRAFSGEGGAVVEVTDKGVGIPADHLDRIFDRFHRVETSRPRERGGAGLGLSIVRSLVSAHGGTITVQSELGRGSTFTVRLPDGGDSRPSSLEPVDQGSRTTR